MLDHVDWFDGSAQQVPEIKSYRDHSIGHGRAIDARENAIHVRSIRACHHNGLLCYS